MHLDREGSQRRLAGPRSSGGQLVGVQVQRADYYRAVDLPVGERSAGVWAGGGDRVQPTAARNAAAARSCLQAALGQYSGPGARFDMRRAVSRLRPYGIRPVRRETPQRPTAGWAALSGREPRRVSLRTARPEGGRRR